MSNNNTQAEQFERRPPVTPSPENELEVAKAPPNSNDTATDGNPDHRVSQLAAHEVRITIQNLTGHDLLLIQGGQNATSDWNPPPPGRIKDGQRKTFGVDNNLFMQGAAGWALYKFADDPYKKYFFQFENPNTGSNYYSYSTPSGYGCNVKGGDGPQASFTFECWKDNRGTFEKKPPVVPKAETAVEHQKEDKNDVKEENALTVEGGKRKEGDTQTNAATPDDPGYQVSQRSMCESHVTIQNLTGHDLVLVTYGKWLTSKWNTSPPHRINDGERKGLEVDCDDFTEGAHGWALYKFADGPYKEYYFQFDVPYVGTNYYNYEAPSGSGCSIKGGGDNPAWVTFECWKANS